MIRLLLFAALSFLPLICFGNHFDATISPQKIIKTKKFNGAIVRLTIQTKASHNYIVEVIGPKSQYKIWKKERYLGMWSKSKYLITQRIPSYQFITSDLNAAEVERIAKNLSIDLQGKKLSFIAQDSYSAEEKSAAIAMLFKSQAQLMYYSSVFEQPQLPLNNTINIPITSRALTGSYDIRIHLFDKGKKVYSHTMTIEVVEDALYYKMLELSRHHKAAYIVISVTITALIGYFANFIFRKNRYFF